MSKTPTTLNLIPSTFFRGRGREEAGRRGAACSRQSTCSHPTKFCAVYKVVNIIRIPAVILKYIKKMYILVTG